MSIARRASFSTRSGDSARLLEARNQSLEAEVNAKPMEIHNHFESGSSSQVFNDRVMGKFTRKQNNKKEKKETKKRWKKIARKVL